MKTEVAATPLVTTCTMAMTVEGIEALDIVAQMIKEIAVPSKNGTENIIEGDPNWGW